MKRIVVLAACFFAAPSWALYKCVAAGGLTSFQEAPCERSQAQTSIKPLVEALKPGVQATSPAEVPSTRPTIQQQLQQAEAERLRTQAGYALRDRTVDLQRHRDFCDRQQREILSNRARANNSLAGAMFEQSVATEAAAAATRCDTRGRELQAEVDEARRQCAARGCL